MVTINFDTSTPIGVSGTAPNPTGVTATITGTYSEGGVTLTFSYAVVGLTKGAVGVGPTHPLITGTPASTGFLGTSHTVASGGPGSGTLALTASSAGSTWLHNPMLDFALVSGPLTVVFTNTVSTSKSFSTLLTSTPTGSVSAAGDFTGIKFIFSGAANSGGGFAVDTLITDLVCFLEGTCVATPDGEVAVETLAIGDPVLTVDGGLASVRWIGMQAVSPIFATPQRDYPVRIQAGALAAGVPHRDLFVSGEHALFINGLLINASALVNGTTITRVADMGRDTFRYYHIETDAHDLILAEGAPAETFVDYVDRQRFHNHADYAALYEEERHIEELPIPRISTARLVPAETRDRLAARARHIGLGDKKKTA